MADLDLSIVVGAVDKLTAPVKKIIGVTGRLSESARRTQAELGRLGSRRRGIERLQGLGKQLGQTASEMDRARNRTAELGRQLAAAANPTKKLQREFEAARRASDALSKRHREQRDGLRRLREELRRTGSPTRGLADAQRRLVEQTERATRKLQDQQRRIERWQGVVERSGKAGRAVGELRNKLVRTGLVAGGLAGLGVELFRRTFVNTAAEFETFQTILTTTEGSSEKAAASMKWISDFAVKTPYELRQVTDAFVKLRAYGLDPTQGLLGSLGDTSAAMGKDLMQAVEAIADAVTGENERLKEFGIKARTKGDVITYEYTHAGETKTAQANARDRAQIEKTLRGIFDLKFGGAMEKQSKTFRGMVSNLLDQWTRFQQMVMEAGVFDWLKTKLSGLLDKLNQLAAGGQLEKIAKQMADKLIRTFEWLWEAGQKALPVIKSVAEGIGKVADAVGGWWNLIKMGVGLKLALDLVPVVRAFGDLGRFALSSEGGLRKLLGRLKDTSAAKAAGKALGGLGGAMKWGLLLNPLTLKIALIGAAVAGLAVLIYKYWGPLKTFFVGLWKGITDAATPVLKTLEPLWTALGPAMSQLGEAVSPLIDWFRNLFAPVEATAAQLGTIGKVGQWLGRILGTVLVKPIRMAVELASALMSAAKGIAWLAGAAWDLGAALVGGIGDAWKGVIEWLEGFSLYDVGTAILTTLGEGILGAGGWLLDQVTSVFGKVRDLLPFSDANEGPLSRLTASGASILGTLGEGMRRMGPAALKRPLARALGSATAGLALTLPVAAQATPAPTRSPSYQAAPANTGGARSIDGSIHIQQLTIQQLPGEDARALATRVLDEIERQRLHRLRKREYDAL